MLFVLLPLCGLLCYILALKNGLGLKRWTFFGTVMGPVALFMFNVHKRRQLHRQCGFLFARFSA